MNFDEIDIRGYSQGGGIVTARDSLHSYFQSPILQELLLSYFNNLYSYL